MMDRRPGRSEAPEYFYTYIDKAPGEDIRALLAAQATEASAWFRAVGEERSLYRYAEGKWSIREVVSHINDCERMFIFRAFWFARELGGKLPSFDQDVAMARAGADERTLASHIAEFDVIRASSLAFVDSVEDEAWDRTGIASDFTFTVRSLAWIAAGHVEHHMRLLRERYVTG